MYYEAAGKQLRRRLLPGKPLRLRASTEDSTKWHDPFAIEVLLVNGDEVRIGWVPRTHSRMVRRMLEERLLLGSSIWRVGTDERLRWIVSMEIVYRRESAGEERIQRILSSMMVPSKDYALLIAAYTQDGTDLEREWIAVYNETVCGDNADEAE